MSTKNTVLILGAGASTPFGFPLGEELKRKVATLSDECLNKNRVHALDKKALQHFDEVIRYNDVNKTIDEFLQEQDDLRGVGLFLIAYAIAMEEKERELLQMKDWYQPFFRELRLTEEEPDLSSLSVVTLNYDRSLEHFINRYITSACPRLKKEFARQKWSKVRIVHAHGSIGDYPAVEYGKAWSGPHLELTSPNMRLFADDPEKPSEALLEARGLLKSAERVAFIGFGYNQHTLDSLFASTEDLSQKQISGTRFEEPDSKVEQWRKYFENKIAFAPMDHKALEFINFIICKDGEKGLFPRMESIGKGGPTPIVPNQNPDFKGFQSPGVKVIRS